MFVFRPTDVVLITVMLSAAAFTYKAKYDTEATRERIGRLEERIQLQKDCLDVLKADWSLLTYPGRLEKLVEAHKAELGLEILEPRQVIQTQALSTIQLRDASQLVAQETKGRLSAASAPMVMGEAQP